MDMNEYSKLSSSILRSTVWQEDLPTKVVWITLLALKDKCGCVEGSVPGLAATAGVTVEECQKALVKFTQPDPYSRNKDNEGRRIREIEGGWEVLNHFCYMDEKEEQRREYQREYMRHRRARLKRKKDQDQKDAFDAGIPVKSALPVGNRTYGMSSGIIPVEGQ